MDPCIVWNYSMQDKIYDSSGMILDKIKFMSRLELFQIWDKIGPWIVWNYSTQDEIHVSSGIILDKTKFMTHLELF